VCRRPSSGAGPPGWTLNAGKASAATGRSGALWRSLRGRAAGPSSGLRAETRPASILLTQLHPDHIGPAPEPAGLCEVPLYVHPADLPLAAPRYPGRYWDPIGRVIEPPMRLLPSKRPQTTLEHLVQDWTRPSRRRARRMAVRDGTGPPPVTLPSTGPRTGPS
jgi:glyoxylase-like metal-dependent hydrolase (beta-lactamase superfamily II)